MQNEAGLADQPRTTMELVAEGHRRYVDICVAVAKREAPDLWPYYTARPAPAICTVYFIGPVDGPIKIGMATRAEFRIRDLRLANAYPLEIWATVEGPPALERDYHRRFKAHRMHGEWFARAPEILAEIENLRSGNR